MYKNPGRGHDPLPFAADAHVYGEDTYKIQIEGLTYTVLLNHVFSTFNLNLG